MDVAVLIPVLNRPDRVEPLLTSLASSLAPGETAWPIFLVSPGDDAQLDAIPEDVDKFVVDWPIGTKADYARKMNRGFDVCYDLGHEWMFLAADDLVFHPGWLTACLREYARQSRSPCVIGTNDLHNSRVVNGLHSTHTLVHRDYRDCGTADEPGLLLHEGYWHNFVDDEFIRTATWRGTYAHAHDALVEHLHPDWNNAEWDDTYRLGKKHFTEDGAYFERRSYLWEFSRGTWG